MMISGLKSAMSCTWRSVMPPPSGNHGEAEALGAVVRAQAAGEQAVAIGDVHLVAGTRARGAHRARHDVRPGVDVLRGVADHGRLAGGARRGVDAHDALHRHREHAEGIGFAQVDLGGERKLRQVGERAQISRAHAGGVELLPVARHVVVGVRRATSAAARAAGACSSSVEHFSTGSSGKLLIFFSAGIRRRPCGNPPRSRPRAAGRAPGRAARRASCAPTRTSALFIRP